MQYDFIDREFFYDFIDGFIDGDFSKEHKTMKLQDAKFFLATLEIYSASLDWGKFECPIGFSIHLTNTGA